MTGTFTARRVETLRPAVRRIVDERIEALALPVSLLVICELLGVPYTSSSRSRPRSSTAGP
ncbi:hypothetical protein [Streptomyces millisiae]|uniref:Uncharacterized protein n=1 Tax=Streptomyces millisiae TaxID=3075542 RepID=A0ABU2LHB2_9ACTN|nr:hypothetical protein [Streptomyces sp. DSM 44918]MDT0316958.1 hypothetical protein [Streptomyces sp. DSM 44918]